MSHDNGAEDLDLDSPWSVVARGGTLSIEEDGSLIAMGDASVEDAEGVARLIASAPDLLDAAADLLVAMASLDARDEDFTPREFEISDPALADMPEDELIVLINTRIKRLAWQSCEPKSGTTMSRPSAVQHVSVHDAVAHDEDD